MSEYELRLRFTAEDDEKARGLAHSWTRTLLAQGLDADQVRLVEVPPHSPDPGKETV